jgi:hypothetical protein
MGLHFSLVAYFIMDLAKFWLPIIASLWVIHFDYLQKNFEKDLQQNLQKQNMWCKRGPKY